MSTKSPGFGVLLSLSMILSVLLCTSSVVASVLMPLQGTVLTRSSGAIVNGNVTVLVYSAATGGVPFYNSSTDFDNMLVNGRYDILAGNGTVPLDLVFGDLYYLDLAINGQDLDFNGSQRQLFQSNLGIVTRIGANATATGTQNIAIGLNASALGTQCVAIGSYASSSGVGSIAIGTNASVTGNNSIAMSLHNESGITSVTVNNVFAITGGKVGINDTNPQTALQVNGTVTVNSLLHLVPVDTVPACGAATTGTMYFDASEIAPCFCNGVDWVLFNETARICG